MSDLVEDIFYYNPRLPQLTEGIRIPQITRDRSLGRNDDVVILLSGNELLTVVDVDPESENLLRLYGPSLKKFKPAPLHSLETVYPPSSMTLETTDGQKYMFSYFRCGDHSTDFIVVPPDPADPLRLYYTSTTDEFLELPKPTPVTLMTIHDAPGFQRHIVVPDTDQLADSCPARPMDIDALTDDERLALDITLVIFGKMLSLINGKWMVVNRLQ